MGKSSTCKNKIIGLILIMLSCIVSNNGQDKSSLNRVEHDENQQHLKMLTPKETKTHIISCQAPQLPGWWCGSGTAMVKILINKEGKVQCASTITGHPAIKKVAEQAAMKWSFRPFLLNGSPVDVLAIIPLDVSWDHFGKVPFCKK